MLRKIMKYDLKELWRSCLPLFVSSSVVSVVCCGLLYFTYAFSEVDGFMKAMGVVMGFYGLGIFAILIMSAISAFLSLVRYYRSLFTDEGYLNMVIPVKISTLLSAKLISVLLWSLVSAVVLVVGIFIAAALPTILYNTSFLADMLQLGENILGINPHINGALFILSIFEMICGAICSVMVILTAITLGSTYIAKHKLLGSILFFFIISFFESAVSSSIGLLSVVLITSATAELSVIITSSLGIVLYLGVSALMYFINLHVMERRFNIE